MLALHPAQSLLIAMEVSRAGEELLLPIVKRIQVLALGHQHWLNIVDGVPAQALVTHGVGVTRHLVCGVQHVVISPGVIVTYALPTLLSPLIFK